MCSRKNFWAIVAFVGLFSFGPCALAQKPQSQPSSPPSTPAASPTSQSMENSNNNNAQPPEPVKQPSKEENKAIKSFRGISPSDGDKKTQSGEEFLQKYPDSGYRPEVIAWLASAYTRKGQIDKLQAEGDKELAMPHPNPASLAALGSNLARAVNNNTPDEQKKLDQAEQLCKKSLELLGSSQKPENVAQDKFDTLKNETSALAYSGLGTAAFRRGHFGDAANNLQQAVKFGSKDPVDYYVLGKAEEAQTNYSEAFTAYTKCAATPSGMQAPCEQSAKEMKSHGAILLK